MRYNKKRGLHIIYNVSKTVWSIVVSWRMLLAKQHLLESIHYWGVLSMWYMTKDSSSSHRHFLEALQGYLGHSWCYYPSPHWLVFIRFSWLFYLISSQKWTVANTVSMYWSALPYFLVVFHGTILFRASFKAPVSIKLGVTLGATGINLNHVTHPKMLPVI